MSHYHLRPLLGLLFLLAGAPLGAELLRERALGADVEIEVRGLPEAAASSALASALAAVRAAEAAVARTALDAGPGADRDLRDVLRRAADFCIWSEGAVSPLGRALYDLWGVRRPAAGIPQPPALGGALSRPLDCAAFRSALEPRAKPQRGRPSLEDFASHLDLWGFERGFAVDRGVAALRAAGATNGRVRIATVTRAFGSGPAGSGWPVVFAPFAGQTRPIAPAMLRDRALAVAGRDEGALRIGGEWVPPYFDQRTGRPGEGKVAVLVSTDVAVDAEGLAMALFAMPTREGEFRAGTLRPRPSLLWLLGAGDGEPLTLESLWSVLRPPR